MPNTSDNSSRSNDTSKGVSGESYRPPRISREQFLSPPSAHNENEAESSPTSTSNEQTSGPPTLLSRPPQQPYHDEAFAAYLRDWEPEAPTGGLVAWLLRMPSSWLFTARRRPEDQLPQTEDGLSEEDRAMLASVNADRSDPMQVVLFILEYFRRVGREFGDIADVIAIVRGPPTRRHLVRGAGGESLREP